MEGSGAAGAGQADAGASAGAEQGAAEGQQQAPGLDLSGVNEHIDKALDQRFEQFGEQLPELLGIPEGEGDGEYQDEGLEGLEGLDPSELYGEDGEIDPEAADAFLGQITQQAANQAVQQAVAPLMQQLEQLRDAHNAQALVAKHPEFQNPDVGKAVSEKAAQVGQALGLQGEQLAGFVVNPAVLELALMAGKAEQAASGEPAEGRSELGLESGTAAGQGSAQPNIGRDIVGAGSSNGFWT